MIFYFVIFYKSKAIVENFVVLKLVLAETEVNKRFKTKPEKLIISDEYRGIEFSFKKNIGKTIKNIFKIYTKKKSLKLIQIEQCFWNSVFSFNDKM